VPARFAYEYGDLQHVFDRDRTSLGAEAALYLAAGKLRLSVTTVDYSAWKEEASWRVRLGLADVNGLIYWAIRLLHG
jgi:hypothetical protein